MVELRWAEGARKGLSRGQPWKAYADMTERVEKARPRCLWPTQVIYYDYVAAWFLTDNGQWSKAMEMLQRLQRTAPEQLRTRLLMARCEMNLGRPKEALEDIKEYVARNPYDVEGYRTMAQLSLPLAAGALRYQVYKVSRFGEADAVRQLLIFYARLGRWEEARKLVEDAVTAGGGAVRPVDVVLPAARQLERTHQAEPLAGLKRTFPDVFEGGRR